MIRSAAAGNAGPRIRSDCEVILEIKDSDGITIDLRSRVKALYGQAIEMQCRELLAYFGVENANLVVNDSGALPFVIAARLESAVAKILGKGKEYLLPMLPENEYSTEKEKFRFSRLYLPGNSPSLMLNAGLHSADGIILDLEDSVAPDKKEEARILVRNALCQVNFYGAERMVRINQGEKGLEDLQYVIPFNVNLVLIPKCENGEEVIAVENEITDLLEKHRLSSPVWLMPIIESAMGVENAFSIASASKNITSIAIGLEDYTSDIGVHRTVEGKESFYARTRIINAARAARIQPIDSVFSDVGDMDGLMQNVLASRSLGFEGMGAIHPRQIAVIQKGYYPSEEEIEKAKKIVLAYEEAVSGGLGVVAIGTKMIDPPVVHRAQKIVNLAIKLDLIRKNWKEEISEEEAKY
jgi:citrate lyase subunit beta / citryl-CoA lyase